MWKSAGSKKKNLAFFAGGAKHRAKCAVFWRSMAFHTNKLCVRVTLVGPLKLHQKRTSASRKVHVFQLRRA